MVLLSVCTPALAEGAPRQKGRVLANLSWVQAKDVLTPATVVVIPLGAQSKEHGPHLPLGADFIQAEYFRNRVLAESDVVVAPTINYSYYPAFVEYPGSTNVQVQVARDLVVDVVRSLARFGPRRFYLLNIGVSTAKPLSEAVALLALDGVDARYLNLRGPAVEAVAARVRTQPEGTHADEIETSIMLAIDPALVDMKKAVADIPPQKATGPLSLDPKNPKYSRSGIYGDATRATPEKGRILVDGITRVIVSQIEELRRATPPAPANVYGPPLIPPAPATTPAH